MRVVAVDQDQADDRCRRGRSFLWDGQGGLLWERGWECQREVGRREGGEDRGAGMRVVGSSVVRCLEPE